ncbi:MAG: DMT family transporter [Burkholderiaceae bacterium]
MHSTVTRGMLLGLAGVLMFSLTLPLTRIAVAAIDARWLALARAEVAALFAAAILWASGQRWPERRHWPALACVAFGVVLGFPLFSSLAMRSTDAAHGSVIVGLLPLLTAIVAARIAGERPGRRFWAATAAGSTVVVAFALREGAGSLQAGDVALLGAVATGAIGYAWGGRLARELGGWQTICWALILAAPILLIPTLWLSWTLDFSAAGPAHWLSFAYISLFSQLIGFFAWYGGMALGGVARVSQVQLLQLFFSLIFAASLVGERVGALTWLTAGIIVAILVVARGAPIRSRVG